MNKLHVSFMKDLLNIEFDGLYSDIIKFMDHEKVEDSNIKLAYKKVRPHVKKIKSIGSSTRHKLSAVNKKLMRMRTDYLISLRMRVQSYMRSHIAEERVAGDYIYDMLKEYGKNYYVPTLHTQSIFVSGIVIKLTEDEKFREAFTLLGIKDLMDTIANISEDLDRNYLIRKNENNASSNNRNGAREAAYKDLKIMVDAINFMLVMNSDNPEKRAYTEGLIWNINEYFKSYRTQMKSRNTKRKNKKAVEVAVNELISTQKTQQKALPVGIGLELSTARSKTAQKIHQSNKKENKDGKKDKNDRRKLPPTGNN